MWIEFEEYYDHSMAAQLRSSKHSSYITSTRLNKTTWRGTISSYLLHFKEQLRLYEETADQPYTDMQKMQFLQNALAGTPELNCVYRHHSAAARAAGIRESITFEEYFAMLMEVANVLDTERVLQVNPRRQHVNVMEVILDEAEDDDNEDRYATLETNAHEQWDQDTTCLLYTSPSPRD